MFGYKRKQVRDNIHSYDLVNMLYHFYLAPRDGEMGKCIVLGELAILTAPLEKLLALLKKF